MRLQPRNGIQRHAEFRMLGIRNLLGSNVGCDFWRKMAGHNQGRRVAWVGVRVNGAVAHRVRVVLGCTHNGAYAVGDMACVGGGTNGPDGVGGYPHEVGDTLVLGYVLHCNHFLIL